MSLRAERSNLPLPLTPSPGGRELEGGFLLTPAREDQHRLF
jgi:hypothetical protein